MEWGRQAACPPTPGQLPARSPGSRSVARSVTTWAQPKLGSWLQLPWDRPWTSGAPEVRPGGSPMSRAKLEGMEMGEPGLPLSRAPGHLGREQGPRNPGQSLSQPAGDTEATTSV